MFWKLLFILYSVCLFIFGYTSCGGSQDDLINATNTEIFGVIILVIIMYLLQNVLYAKTRQIRTISLGTTKVFVGMLVLLNIFLAVLQLIRIDSFVSVFHAIASFEILTIIIALILIPFYIPFVSYLRSYFKFNKQLKNQFFSTIALFILTTLVLPNTVYDLIELLNGQIEFGDAICFLSEAFAMICYLGFVLRKNLISRKLSQVLCIPALLIYNLGISRTELVNLINEYLKYPITLNIITVIYVILNILIIYRYCFTNLVQDIPDYIEVETIEASDTSLFSKIKNEHQQKHRVSKLVYFLLCFFLGGLGVHKFYAGKPKIGLIYLLLCWCTVLPAILSFVDLIYACIQKADQYGDIEV